MDQPRERRRWRGWGALLGVLLLAPLAGAAPLPENVEHLRKRAREQVAQKQWTAAHDLYIRIPRAERSVEDRDNLQTCVRRLLQARRLRDKPALLLLGRMPTSQALSIYRDVVEMLQGRYVERDKVTLPRLFLQGVEELRAALDDQAFVREQLSDARSEGLRSFKEYLDELRQQPPACANLRELRDQFQAVVNAALAARLKPGLVLLEFVCGACHSLDEYTLFLGHAGLLDAEREREGKAIGIGIEVAAVDQRLVVTRVYRNSPAEAAEIRPGDAILAIDGQPIDPAMPTASAGRLVGEEGTLVDVEVIRPLPDGMLVMPSRTVRLERRLVAVPSVDVGEEFRDGMREHTGIGYIKIHSFQKTTAHELKEAIFDLSARMGEMKGLVLDLRGNPGGLFSAALQVAELFVPDGILAYTQGRSREEAHRANNPAAFAMPLVVLIDGETASAAEVVAAALKERGRATLVGQTTYGKNSMQDVFRLKSLNAGLQITLARFCSPAHAGFDGRGVTPDRLVERYPMSVGDAPRDVAFQLADGLARMVPR